MSKLSKRIDTTHSRYGRAFYPMLAEELHQLFDDVEINQGISHRFQLTSGLVPDNQVSTFDDDGTRYDWFCSSKFKFEWCNIKSRKAETGIVLIAFPWKTDGELKVDGTPSDRFIAVFRDAGVSDQMVNQALDKLILLFREILQKQTLNRLEAQQREYQTEEGSRQSEIIQMADQRQMRLVS